MAKLYVFISKFLLYGVIWFAIFSIHITPNRTLFSHLKAIVSNIFSSEKNEKTAHDIDSEKVINAMKDAFKP